MIGSLRTSKEKRKGDNYPKDYHTINIFLSPAEVEALGKATLEGRLIPLANKNSPEHLILDIKWFPDTVIRSGGTCEIALPEDSYQQLTKDNLKGHAITYQTYILHVHNKRTMNLSWGRLYEELKAFE